MNVDPTVVLLLGLALLLGAAVAVWFLRRSR